MWFAAAFIVTLVVLTIIMVAPVTVEIKYSYFRLNAPREGAPQEYAPDRGVRISLFWGLVNLNIKLSSINVAYRAFTPVIKLRARLSQRSGTTLAREKTRLTPGQALRLFKKAAVLYRTTAPVYHHLLSRTALHRLHWSTGVGLSEAGYTGMATGILWMIKSSAASFVYRKLAKPAPLPELEVVPVFDRQYLRISFDCIFSLRTGHIIYTGLLAGWLLFKNRHLIRS